MQHEDRTLKSSFLPAEVSANTSVIQPKSWQYAFPSVSLAIFCPHLHSFYGTSSLQCLRSNGSFRQSTNWKAVEDSLWWTFFNWGTLTYAMHQVASFLRNDRSPFLSHARGVFLLSTQSRWLQLHMQHFFKTPLNILSNMEVGKRKQAYKHKCFLCNCSACAS